jgi:hypothetical protein
MNAGPIRNANETRTEPRPTGSGLLKEQNLHMQWRGSTEGVAVLEAALVLPVLVALMLNVANFGMYIYAWVTVNNAARALVEYRVYTGVVLGYPPTPSVTQMQNLVTDEVSSLPNKASVSWAVCWKKNTTTTCQGPGAAFAPDTDPINATGYTLYSAKVSYTFLQLFPGGTLPLQSLAGPVSRQVNMRSMQ